MRQGEIVQCRGGLCTVREENGDEQLLWIRKKFRRDSLTPAGRPGAVFPGSGEEKGWVEEILPRRSLMVRPQVANIDAMVIVVATEPAPDWLLVDKLLVHASLQEILPLIAVNKSDLGDRTYEEAAALYGGGDIRCVKVSARTGEGFPLLEDALRGRFGCLAGQSGVGKSAVLSRLMEAELVSGDISQRIGRGRQTTRHTSLLYHKGLKMLDTPGFSLLELPGGLTPEELPLHYPEFAPYAQGCRFQPCLHLNEPGCAVKEAELAGRIHPRRMAGYRELAALVSSAWKERYD